MSLAATLLPVLDRAAQLAAGRDRAGTLTRCRDLIARCPEQRRDLVAAAVAVAHPSIARCVLGESPRDARVDRALELAPYPAAPVSIRARLVLGESPASVSRGLTRAEAHRWLTESPDRPPAEWLLCQHGLGDQPVDDVAVARWLISCWQDPPRRAALCRTREERGPAGQVVHGAYLDRVDELRRGDLRPSVDETYRRCAWRLQAAVERSLRTRGEPLAPVPQWWRPLRCARLLRSAADLAAEGRVLEHCVASYVQYVRDGRSVIVGMHVLGHRSTVEIERGTLKVRQHKGPRNRAPHELCERALQVLLRRCGATEGRKE